MMLCLAWKSLLDIMAIHMCLIIMQKVTVYCCRLLRKHKFSSWHKHTPSVTWKGCSCFTYFSRTPCTYGLQNPKNILSCWILFTMTLCFLVFNNQNVCLQKSNSWLHHYFVLPVFHVTSQSCFVVIFQVENKDSLCLGFRKYPSNVFNCNYFPYYYYIYYILLL